MKNTILILITVLSIQFAFAQQGKGGEDLEEKYYTQKVAYLTTEMELTADESAAFWPLYNDQERKQNVLKNEMKAFRKKLYNTEEDLSEEEALEALALYQSHITEMNKLEIEYQGKYLEVISAKKVLLMLKAEKDFRRELLRKLGNKRQHQNKK